MAIDAEEANRVCVGGCHKIEPYDQDPNPGGRTIFLASFRLFLVPFG
jgi:hypothetical protein